MKDEVEVVEVEEEKERKKTTTADLQQQQEEEDVCSVCIEVTAKGYDKICTQDMLRKGNAHLVLQRNPSEQLES